MTIFETKINTPDPIYEQLKGLSEQRVFTDELFNRFKQYADKDFVTQFARHCIERYWEMYLGCALIDNGFNLVPKKDLSNEGPDFCIVQNDSRIWIEAVTISAGTGADSLISEKEEIKEYSDPIPNDKIVLRFCSAIRYKYCKYLKYISKGTVKPNESFFIAINGAGDGIPVEYWAAEPDVPFAIQAVLPIGQYSVTFDPRTKYIYKEGPEHREFIIKLSGSPVLTNCFFDCLYSLISGLLFSNIHPFWCKSVSLRNVSLLNNPKSLHPFEEWISIGSKWQLKEKGDVYLLER